MNTYKPSGRVPALSILFGIMSALIVSPLLAAIYAYSIVYIPFIYINVFLAMALGAAVSFAVRSALNAGKCRNALVMTIVILLSLALAYYLHWGFWAVALLGKSDLPVSFSMVFDPGSLVEFIKIIYKTGTWGISGDPISGIFLLVVWVFEALLIVGVGALMAFSFGGDPFCEECGEWCVERDSDRFFSNNGSQDELAVALNTQGITAINTLEATASLPCLGFDIWSCECGKTQTLHLKTLETTNKDGKWVQEATLVGQHLLATQEDIDHLLSVEKAEISEESNRLPHLPRPGA